MARRERVNLGRAWDFAKRLGGANGACGWSFDDWGRRRELGIEVLALAADGRGVFQPGHHSLNGT